MILYFHSSLESVVHHKRFRKSGSLAFNVALVNIWGQPQNNQKIKDATRPTRKRQPQGVASAIPITTTISSALLRLVLQTTPRSLPNLAILSHRTPSNRGVSRRVSPTLLKPPEADTIYFLGHLSYQNTLANYRHELANSRGYTPPDHLRELVLGTSHHAVMDYRPAEGEA